MEGRQCSCLLLVTFIILWARAAPPSPKWKGGPAAPCPPGNPNNAKNGREREDRNNKRQYISLFPLFLNMEGEGDFTHAAQSPQQKDGHAFFCLRGNRCPGTTTPLLHTIHALVTQRARWVKIDWVAQSDFSLEERMPSKVGAPIPVTLSRLSYF